MTHALQAPTYNYLLTDSTEYCFSSSTTYLARYSSSISSSSPNKGSRVHCRGCVLDTKYYSVRRGTIRTDTAETRKIETALAAGTRGV